jgi:hypothetical protein
MIVGVTPNPQVMHAFVIRVHEWRFATLAT